MANKTIKEKGYKDILDYCIKTQDRGVASALYLTIRLHNLNGISDKTYQKSLNKLRNLIKKNEVGRLKKMRLEVKRNG